MTLLRSPCDAVASKPRALQTAKRIPTGAHGDDALTSCVAVRSDLPAQLFDQLLARASEKVRSQLQAEREFAKADINSVVGEVTERIQVKRCDAADQLRCCPGAGGINAPSCPIDRRETAGIRCDGSVRKNSCRRIPSCRTYRPRLSNRTCATHMPRPCSSAKAIGLSCETTRSIMILAAKRHRHSTASVHQAMPAFHRLRQSTGQQILDFHRMSSRAARPH